MACELDAEYGSTARGTRPTDTPCVRGARVPVYTILGRLEEGEPFDEIVADYVPRAALEAAVAYARTHPRRGRPKQFR
ncbi:MAG: DUF433 domain-containing protein [Deltaproteobacteria bacterium]|nr:DUF433 domain-containing protein [Deltaproteobacteria bacterium]